MDYQENQDHPLYEQEIDLPCPDEEEDQKDPLKNELIVVKIEKEDLKQEEIDIPCSEMDRDDNCVTDPLETEVTHVKIENEAVQKETVLDQIDATSSKNYCNLCKKYKNITDDEPYDVNFICDGRCKSLRPEPDKNAVTSVNEDFRSVECGENNEDYDRELKDSELKNDILVENGVKLSSDSMKGKHFSCAFCEEEFDTPNELEFHLLFTHENLKPIFVCKFCKKQLKNIRDYTKHLHTHTGERPFTCGICEKSFARPQYLRVHIRIHTGERPYKCDQCEESFTSSLYLRYHALKHSGERPFVCDVCGNSFKDRAGLRAHTNIHTRERLHPCEHCQKNFLSTSALRRHIRNVHK